jgi:hypothetical protein
MTNHPPLGLVDVFAATLPTLKSSPGVHVNYAETVLPIRDASHSHRTRKSTRGALMGIDTITTPADCRRR